MCPMCLARQKTLEKVVESLDNSRISEAKRLTGVTRIWDGGKQHEGLYYYMGELTARTSHSPGFPRLGLPCGRTACSSAKLVSE